MRTLDKFTVTINWRDYQFDTLEMACEFAQTAVLHAERDENMEAVVTIKANEVE